MCVLQDLKEHTETIRVSLFSALSREMLISVQSVVEFAKRIPVKTPHFLHICTNVSHGRNDQFYGDGIAFMVPIKISGSIDL